MTKHVITLVRLLTTIAPLMGVLVNFLLREDVEKLINSANRVAEQFPTADLCQALSLAIQHLQASAKPDPDPLRDAKFAANRIGVVDRTIRRLTAKGKLPVHSYFNGKRWFLESDIERCKHYYHKG